MLITNTKWHLHRNLGEKPSILDWIKGLFKSVNNVPSSKT